MSLVSRQQPLIQQTTQPQPQPQSYRQQTRQKYPAYPRRILQTIYGGKFARNSKQLTPINLSTQSNGNSTSNSHQDKKLMMNNNNTNVGISSDYYTFQKVISNFTNKNHHNLNYTARNSSTPINNVNRNSSASNALHSPAKTIQNHQNLIVNQQAKNQNKVKDKSANNINYDRFRKTFSISRPSLNMPTMPGNAPYTHININSNNNDTNPNNKMSLSKIRQRSRINMPDKRSTPTNGYYGTYNPPKQQYNTCISHVSNTSTDKNGQKLSISRKNSNSNMKNSQHVKIMNNTTTGFNRNVSSVNSNINPNRTTATNFNPSPNTTKNQSVSNKNYSILSNTTTNFRPPTSHMRQCNNEAEDHNNYLSKYEIIRELGKGTYGVVHLARKKQKKTRNSEVISTSNNEQLFLFNYGSIVREKIRQSSLILEPYDKEEQKQQEYKSMIDNINKKSRVHQVEEQRVQQKQQQGIEAPTQRKQYLEPQIITTNNSNPVMQHPTIQRSQSPPLQPQTPKHKPIEITQNDQQCAQEYFAIKIYQKFKMNKDPTKFKNIRKQINIMQNIEHPNIIKLYESVETLTKINIVVQYGGKQSLLDYLKDKYPLNDSEMRRIALQLLSAINYLHQKNIVHRDIKLQNILMFNGNAKIIDFGFSTLTHKNRKLNSICGTPNYMAPEVLSKKQYIGQFADIWSYGVVMFTIAEGRHPFKAQSYNQLQRIVNKGAYQFKKITNPIHQAFIKRILKTKPQDRPRASDLLTHPWLAMHEEAELQNTIINTKPNPLITDIKIQTINTNGSIKNK